MTNPSYHKDAINRRLDNNQSFVETAIFYRVSRLNRTVLGDWGLDMRYRVWGIGKNLVYIL
ncbi:MAG: hypothetical protein V7K97_26655 [Nostoc sp.]|uniref:hypothetical protein n=1 Tax=Nostoc sp. TaxID=1180 RepID=UPI002FF5CEC1